MKILCLILTDEGNLQIVDTSNPNSIYKVITVQNQPETTKPDTTKPETTKPDTTQPNTTKPYITQPYTTQPIMNNISSLLPNLSFESIVPFLNSGIDLLALYSDKNYMSEKGMHFDSQLRGPSTNIYQQNFSGSSNVYSPYLY